MENETQNQTIETSPIVQPAKKNYVLPISVLAAALILAGAWVYTEGLASINRQTADISEHSGKTQNSTLEEKVVPSAGVALPVTWGDLGSKLASAGVIDAGKFQDIYEQHGAFTQEYKNLLLGQKNGTLTITNENAGYLLNLFWALGLANKNPILDSGEMKNPAYGGAQNFASTAGWTIAQGDPMDHYSRHSFFTLTAEQQALVDKVASGIYRPCCGNSTHFPDCNHGMAMLGLLELMASQGASEQTMWKTALTVNSYWFSDTYLTIATYMKNKGIDWREVNPEEVLGENFSSAAGYRRIASQVIQPTQQRGGNGCGVDTGTVITPQRSQSDCGI